MAVPQKIIKFLEKNKVKYEPIKHRTVFTAYDKAQTLKVPEKIVGKTLVMKVDNSPALILIPANKNLDKNKLKRVSKGKKIDFAKESLTKNKIKGVKVGAVPPFGNLWNLATFVDRSLMNQPKIIINGGDYQWSIKIKPKDFKKLIPDLAISSFTKAKK